MEYPTTSGKLPCFCSRGYSAKGVYMYTLCGLKGCPGFVDYAYLHQG